MTNTNIEVLRRASGCFTAAASQPRNTMFCLKIQHSLERYGIRSDFYFLNYVRGAVSSFWGCVVFSGVAGRHNCNHLNVRTHELTANASLPPQENATAQGFHIESGRYYSDIPELMTECISSASARPGSAPVQTETRLEIKRRPLQDGAGLQPVDKVQKKSEQRFSGWFLEIKLLKIAMEERFFAL